MWSGSHRKELLGTWLILASACEAVFHFCLAGWFSFHTVFTESFPFSYSYYGDIIHGRYPWMQSLPNSFIPFIYWTKCLLVVACAGDQNEGNSFILGFKWELCHRNLLICTEYSVMNCLQNFLSPHVLKNARRH